MLLGGFAPVWEEAGQVGFFYVKLPHFVLQNAIVTCVTYILLRLIIHTRRFVIHKNYLVREVLGTRDAISTQGSDL